MHDSDTDSLGSARNQAAAMLDTDWIIFLDADDYLDVNYVEAMSNMAENGYYDLIQPATRGYYGDGTKDDAPYLIPSRNLMESNYLVIGTMCRRELFNEVGGFDVDLPVLEDWDLWIRMYLKGAVIGPCEAAVYMVGVNEDSRNSVKNSHHEYYGIIRARY